MNAAVEKIGINQDDNKLFFTMIFVMSTSGLAATLIGSLLPYIQQTYNLSFAQSGNLISSHYVGNVGALVLAGFLPYALGRKKSTLLLGSGVIIAYALMIITGNPLLLMLAFLFSGLSRGAWSNITNTVVGEIATKKVVALNILHASFSIGAIMCPVIMLVGMDILGFSWKIGAIFAVIMGIIVFWLVSISPISDTPTKKVADSNESKSFAKSSDFWIATGILFFYLGAEASTVGWLVSYFGNAGLLSPVMSTLTPTMLWFAVMLGRINCAVIAKKLNRQVLLIVMGLFASLFFILMLLFKSPVPIIISLFGFGFSVGGVAPTTISAFSKYKSSLATGVGMGIGTAGGIVMPTVVGMAADRIGLTGGVATISVFCVLMLVFMFINAGNVKRREG